jgi:hypothetical protein
MHFGNLLKQWVPHIAQSDQKKSIDEQELDP